MSSVNDTNFFLARQVLSERFLQKCNFEHFEAERAKFHGLLTTRNGKYLYARMMMSEVHFILCDAYISSLSEEKQKFIYMKYRDGANLVNIQMNLYTSIAQLNNWNLQILKSLTDYLLLQLSSNDIYYRKRIINMVNILTKIIEFFSRIDPDYSIATKEYIFKLQDKYNSYRELLEKIDDVIRTKDANQQNEAVALKYYYPNEPSEELCNKINISKDLFLKHIRTFKQEVIHYITI